MTSKIPIKFGRGSSSYEINIGSSILPSCGEWAIKSLKTRSKIAVISNKKVFGLYGNVVVKSLKSAGFRPVVFLMNDGERYKNFRTIENVLNFLSSSDLTRTDAVVALGGGVVGDLAGFAAAVYLRGIRFLQIPTSLLAMVDSSVGGKTGVNSTAGKNLIGAFHQPSGVLVDIDVLKTLPRRELTAGFCEMVKHAAISGKKLLTQTDELLNRFPIRGFAKYFGDENFSSEISNLIRANIELKAMIVAGDERESSGRRDARSRKVLNFGHTLAHALEKATDYRLLRHGEAVGYGISFAAELSKSLDLLDVNSVNCLNGVLHRVGPLPSLSDVDPKRVLNAFSADKKNIDGKLQMVLLNGLGHPIIRSRSDIPDTAFRSALRTVLR